MIWTLYVYYISYVKGMFSQKVPGFYGWNWEVCSLDKNACLERKIKILNSIYGKNEDWRKWLNGISEWQWLTENSMPALLLSRENRIFDPWSYCLIDLKSENTWKILDSLPKENYNIFDYKTTLKKIFWSKFDKAKWK